MKRRPVRWGVVLLWSLAGNFLVLALSYLWMAANPYPAFKLAEKIHTQDLRLNDLRYKGITSNHEIVTEFNRFIDAEDPVILTDVLRALWNYKHDFILWDVASPPVITFIQQGGDCDDYARLACYIFHRKGYEAYFVVINTEKVGRGGSGHAVCIYLNQETKTLHLTDNNGFDSLKLDSGDVATYVINGSELKALIKLAYPQYEYISVRDWTARNILYFTKVSD